MFIKYLFIRNRSRLCGYVEKGEWNSICGVNRLLISPYLGGGMLPLLWRNVDNFSPARRAFFTLADILGLGLDTAIYGGDYSGTVERVLHKWSHLSTVLRHLSTVFGAERRRVRHFFVFVMPKCGI